MNYFLPLWQISSSKLLLLNSIGIVVEVTSDRYFSGGSRLGFRRGRKSPVALRLSFQGQLTAVYPTYQTFLLSASVVDLA